MVEGARGEAAGIRGEGQAHIAQLSRTIEILQQGGNQAMTAYIIERFGDVVGAFAGTMDLFPVDHVTVIAGRRTPDGPISAIHPSAVDAALNQRLAAVLGAVGVAAAPAPARQPEPPAPAPQPAPPPAPQPPAERPAPWGKK
jgi:hypothetical protein